MIPLTLELTASVCALLAVVGIVWVSTRRYIRRQWADMSAWQPRQHNDKQAFEWWINP